MKNFILIFFAAFIYQISSANSNSHHGHAHAPDQSYICSYYGENITTPITSFAPSYAAKDVIGNIIDVIGLQPKFEIRASNVPNAAAMVQNGRRFILYNEEFIKSIERTAGSSWASIGIMAHEIGHHLNGHTLLGTGSRPAIELEADEFSGFALRKMGATLQQAQLAMQVAAHTRASATHPGKNDRLKAIAEGWNKADRQMAGATAKLPSASPQTRTSTTTTARTSTPAPARTVLDARYVSYNAFFAADKNQPYYITTQNNLVTTKNNKVEVIGKMEATGRKDLPYSIKTQNSRWHINSRGTIVNASGAAIGYLQKK